MTNLPSTLSSYCPKLEYRFTVDAEPPTKILAVFIDSGDEAVRDARVRLDGPMAHRIRLTLTDKSGDQV